MTDSTREELTLYGTWWCPDVARTRRYLDQQGVLYRYRDIDDDPEALALITQANGGDWIVPTIALADGTFLFNPSLRDLDRVLGLPRRASR